jgi:hypothetical protein
MKAKSKFLAHKQLSKFNVRLKLNLGSWIFKCGSYIQKSKNPKPNQPLRQNCFHEGKVQILSSQATPQIQFEVEIELGELDF